MSLGLNIDFNLFEYILAMFTGEQEKITKNRPIDSEVSSAKSIFLGEEKEFLRKLSLNLKLSI